VSKRVKWRCDFEKAIWNGIAASEFGLDTTSDQLEIKCTTRKNGRSRHLNILVTVISYQRAKHFEISGCSLLYFAEPGQLIIYPASIHTMQIYFKDYRIVCVKLQPVFSSTEDSFQWFLPDGKILKIEPVKFWKDLFTFDAGDYIIFRQDIIHAGN
jgi:hypothetical protein